MLGTCHFEKKIGTIISCPYLIIGPHNSVSLTRKVQIHKIKRRIAVYKNARIITLSQINTYGDSEFLLVSK